MTESDKLLRELKHLLIPEAVDEAFTVLNVMKNTSWYDSFWEEKEKRSGNTQCLAIDFAKFFAVLDGKMEQKENDQFGDNSDGMIESVIKVVVWLEKDYSKSETFHMPNKKDKEKVTQEVHRRFGDTGWCYYDIHDVELKK